MPLECQGITVTYRDGNAVRTVLNDVTVDNTDGPLVVMGPSGSGKSTLLRVLSGAQGPEAGSVHLDGREVRHKSEAHHAQFAVVHQDYRLIDFLTVRENLEIAAELRRLPRPAERAKHGLKIVGLDGRDEGRISTLSGGEQQRLAIARALISDPRVIIADEPTGALDTTTSREIAELLLSTAGRSGAILVVATHDRIVAEVLGGARFIRDGKLSQPEELAAC